MRGADRVRIAVEATLRAELHERGGLGAEWFLAMADDRAEGLAMHERYASQRAMAVRSAMRSNEE